MRAKVNQDGCISCGLCENLCPEVFFINDQGVAEAKDSDIPDQLKDAAKEARDNCPVSVIDIEE